MAGMAWPSIVTLSGLGIKRKMREDDPSVMATTERPVGRGLWKYR